MSNVDALTPAEVLAVRAMLTAAATPPPPPTADQLAASAAGFIADVAPNQLIASAWGNSIRDDVIMRFATSADRDLYWPAATAPVGARCITMNDHATWLHTGAGWVQEWVKINSVFTNIASASHPGVPGVIVLGNATPVQRSYPTIVVIHATFTFGFSTAAMNATPDLQRFADSTTSPSNGPMQAIASVFTCVPVLWAYPVAANDDPSFQFRLNVAAASAGFFASATAVTEMFIQDTAPSTRPGDTEAP